MVDLTQVIVALLTLAISAVSAFLIPYIKSKVSAEQLDAIKFWVNIAVEAADIALMSDDISKIPYLKRLSNATVATIKFSISLSMCVNLSAVACSILGILNPTTGALVLNAGSCFVVLIAALLYDRKFE